MMTFSQFSESEHKGTYVGVRFNRASAKALTKQCRDLGIPNVINSEKLHSTLIYSRNQLTEFSPHGKMNHTVQGAVIPHVFETQSGKRAMVLKLTDPWFESRHKEIMTNHPEATYDYPDYQPHITVSYDIGDYVIPSTFVIGTPLILTEEYEEDLNLDWATKS